MLSTFLPEDSTVASVPFVSPSGISSSAIFLTISSGTCSKCVLGSFDLGIEIHPFSHVKPSRPQPIRVNSF